MPEIVENAHRYMYLGTRMAKALKGVIRTGSISSSDFSTSLVLDASEFFSKSLQDGDLALNKERKIADAVFSQESKRRGKVNSRRLKRFSVFVRSLSRPRKLRRRSVQIVKDLSRFFDGFENVIESRYEEMMRKSHEHLDR